MKVIDEPEKWSTVAKCDVCEAKLEVELGDVLIGTFDAERGSSGTKEPYCICVRCESPVRLGRYAPPIVWRVGIENTRKLNEVNRDG